MAIVYFDEGERPTPDNEGAIGSFYPAGDNHEMVAYIHRDWKEGDDLPIIDAFPDKYDTMMEMLNTRSFIMTGELAKNFVSTIRALAEKNEVEDGSVDSSEG